jgi:hypothetical protein
LRVGGLGVGKGEDGELSPPPLQAGTDPMTRSVHTASSRTERRTVDPL